METSLPIKKNNDLQTVVNSYESPAIEVLEIVIEKGFAASAEDWNPGAW